MKKHESSDDMKKELDVLLSKLNALEIIAADEFQKGVVKVLRKLVEGQIHSVNEFDHLKKALDLITLQLFDVKTKSDHDLRTVSDSPHSVHFTSMEFPKSRTFSILEPQHGQFICFESDIAYGPIFVDYFVCKSFSLVWCGAPHRIY